MTRTRLPTARAVAAALLLAAAAALQACASTGGAASSDAAGPDADRRFYEARCGVCHVPFHPRALPAERWPSIVAFFGPRAGLTASQRERVVSYLTAAAAAPR